MHALEITMGYADQKQLREAQGLKGLPHCSNQPTMMSNQKTLGYSKGGHIRSLHWTL